MISTAAAPEDSRKVSRFTSKCFPSMQLSTYGGGGLLQAELLGRGLLGRGLLGRSLLEGEFLLGDGLGGRGLSDSSSGEQRSLECTGRSQKQSENCSELHC